MCNCLLSLLLELKMLVFSSALINTLLKEGDCFETRQNIVASFHNARESSCLCIFSPRRRREDGIGMVLRETDLGGVDWILLAQDMDRWRAVVSAVVNFLLLVPRSWLVGWLVRRY
jgi:hypothetical protein